MGQFIVSDLLQAESHMLLDLKMAQSGSGIRSLPASMPPPGLLLLTQMECLNKHTVARSTAKRSSRMHQTLFLLSRVLHY